MLPTLFFSSRAARSLGRLAGNQCRKLRSSRSNPPVTTQNGRLVFSAWRGFHASSMFRDSDSKTGHVWSEEWKNVKLGAKRPSEHSEVDMKQVRTTEATPAFQGGRLPDRFCDVLRCSSSKRVLDATNTAIGSYVTHAYVFDMPEIERVHVSAGPVWAQQRRPYEPVAMRSSSIPSHASQTLFQV
eukprot:3859236-Rhodomonas_salina.1